MSACAPKARGRSPAPIHSEPYAISMLLLISRSAGKPCPTREDIVSACGVCRKRVPAFLEDLQNRGLIEIETKDNGWSRRMRVQAGNWTAWTHRPNGEWSEADPVRRATGGLRKGRKWYGKVITTRRGA